MAYQMAQEGPFWPRGMIRFGPYWHNSKMTWADIVNAVQNIGTIQHKKANILTLSEQLENSLAQSYLYLSQFGPS